MARILNSWATGMALIAILASPVLANSHTTAGTSPLVVRERQAVSGVVPPAALDLLVLVATGTLDWHMPRTATAALELPTQVPCPVLV